MDTTELIRTVVQEVLARMEKPRPHSCVMVLDERKDSLVQTLGAQVEALYGAGTELLFRGEESGGRVPRCWLLPLLSCSDMAELAGGRASSPLMREVLDLLLHGTEIAVLEYEYRRFGDSAPEALYALYARYEQVLRDYGLKEFCPKAPEERRVREKVLTAAMVEEAAGAGVRHLQVAPQTVITPLALDAATLHGVEISKKDRS